MSSKQRSLKSWGIVVFIFSALAVLFVTIIVAMLMLRKISQESWAAQCAEANLQPICKAIFAYSQDNNEFYPTTGQPNDSAASLCLLYPYFGGQAEMYRILLCPADEKTRAFRAAMDEELPWPVPEGACSYYYDNSVLPDTSSDTIILFDKNPGIHSGGRNAGTLAGDCRRFSEEEFQRYIQSQKKRATESGRRLE